MILVSNSCVLLCNIVGLSGDGGAARAKYPSIASDGARRVIVEPERVGAVGRRGRDVAEGVGLVLKAVGAYEQEEKHAAEDDDGDQPRTEATSRILPHPERRR